MKKGIFILLGIFMMVSTVEANHGKKSPSRIGFNYTYNNSVNFEEQGIQFFIFTNGEFDFNSNNNYYNSHINRERGIYRDYRGQITRIGNSFIRYDSYGNVIRIGNVFMKYYRGKLTDVGHLKVRYDYWGNPTFYGNVKNNYYHYKGLRINLNIGDICSYRDPYFYGNHFRANYLRIREDNNYYYYRANPNAEIGKRSKILRRRKPNSKSVKNTSIRNVTTSYRKPSNLNMLTTVPTKIRRTTNTSYRPNNSLGNINVKPVKRKTNSTLKRSNPLKKKVANTTRKKIGGKDRSVIIRRN
jgi:hypothetical protein